MAKKRFKPGLAAVVVTILMLAILLYLGSWQMSRSNEKQALIESYKAAPDMRPVGLSELSGDWEQHRFRKIELSGRYENERQLLLENQIHENQSGYMVFTPFKLDDPGAGYVLVNRGWIERTAGNNVLPRVDVVDERRTIRGLVNHQPDVGVRLGSLDDSMPGWPKAVPYLDNDWLALQLANDIKPWVVLLSEGESDGFIRHWKPSLQMGPRKHMGYAFQWFALAVGLLFLFIIASLKTEDDVEDGQDIQG